MSAQIKLIVRQCYIQEVYEEQIGISRDKSCPHWGAAATGAVTDLQLQGKSPFSVHCSYRAKLQQLHNTLMLCTVKVDCSIASSTCIFCK